MPSRVSYPFVSQQHLKADSAHANSTLSKSKLIHSLNEFFPHSPHPNSFLKNEITADIHTSRDFAKHTESLDQAEKAGQLIYRAESDSSTRRMGISLVKKEVGSTGTLVEDEIFGPILPIIAVKVR